MVILENENKSSVVLLFVQNMYCSVMPVLITEKQVLAKLKLEHLNS